MKNNILVSLIIITFSLASCDWQYTEFLDLRNNTTDSLFCAISVGTKDTSYSSFYREEIKSIIPVSRGFIFSWNGRKGRGPSQFAMGADTLRVLILKNHPNDYSIPDSWNVYDHYLVRYDLSYNDITRLKFQIAYPPTPEMQYIRMYPPYEEVLAKFPDYQSE